MSDTSTDPQKYIVKRHDFRRLPRWENDGIQQKKNEIDNDLDNTQQDTPRETKHATSDLQRELAELVGDWVLDSEIDDPMYRDFVLGLPGMFQVEAGQKQDDLGAAQTNLIANRKDPKVLEILEDVGYRKAIYKASKDPRRFPDWKSLLAPILQKGWGSDKYLNLLFGNVAFVRGVLLEVGHMVAEPPPFGSPAYALWQPILEQNGEARVKPACGYCEKKEPEGKALLKCSGCRSIKYCNRDCQRKDWPVHKPDCLEKQGKPVPQDVRQKAEAALATWKAEANQNIQTQHEMYMNKLQGMWEAYLTEDATVAIQWSHDCKGNRYRLDLPVEGENILKLVAGLADLKVEKDIELGIFPEGVPQDLSIRGLGLLCSTKETNAKILILYERLFSNHGNGTFSGLTIVGIWVVDRHIKNPGGSQRVAVWKKVAATKERVPPSNRCHRLVAHLEKAKSLAVCVPAQVGLGIHDVKEEMEKMNHIETQFGSYMTLHP